MTYYRKNESIIPASPLVEEHKVPIEELYVLPPMWAYDKPLNFGLGKNTQQGEQTPVKDVQRKQKATFSQLFVSDRNVRCRNIYITADAGFGKTSLSQKLTMTWCQAHSPMTSLIKKYKVEELGTMKYFEFLFLLHLRDYQGEPLCNLDDLIMQMLSNNLSRNTLYTKEFLQRLLHEKECLILLDGLDEWSHPDKCGKTPAVPHNNHLNSCTVLTTSRPWKLGTIGLWENNIDRHIEISELNDETRWQIEKNAIRILNERNLNLAGKNITDFDREIRSVEIGNTIYIPYILLQLMCLFFGGRPIGKSKCEIYSNVTEITLKRGLNKTNLPDVQRNENTPVPNCFKRNKKCNLYLNLIMKLGKLAFCALFSEKKESSLIFDRRYAKEFMTKQEIEFCLKVGLLCQTKDSRIIAVKRYQVFFQHKSEQEFFAAIYITSEWKNKSVQLTILKVCSSLPTILEMTNLFVFVCGINPDVFRCISGELQKKVVDSDIKARRCTIDKYHDGARIICSYNLMQIQCLQESMRNGNESCPIYLYVMLDNFLIDYINMNLTEYITALTTIIHFNKCHMKLLQISWHEDETAAFIQSLAPSVFSSLRILKVDGCRQELLRLANILTESARTLECLTVLPNASYIHSLSDISIRAITRMSCLQSLCLARVHITHSYLKSLYAFISETTTLTQLKLSDIRCWNYEGRSHVCDVTLDLHLLNELERVELEGLHMSSSAWKKLLLSVVDLPLRVTVKLYNCDGPSEQEWQTIVKVIKSTPSLSLKQELCICKSWVGDHASLLLATKKIIYD